MQGKFYLDFFPLKKKTYSYSQYMEHEWNIPRYK